MKLTLYNTLTRKKEIILKKDLLIYTCGPTVYNFAHIGNLRTYVFEDLLKKTLLFFGYSVRHVMNVTDVEDKTIQSAKESGESLKSYTEKYTKAFMQDLNTLHIAKADAYPRATEYISEMTSMIEDLVEKKIAYIGSDHSVYFSIDKYKDYGKLSHLKLGELKEGASQRISDEYEKENAADFVLWKAYDSKRDGDVFWESPFGKGRPGWHIECSAMAIKLLGETIDIHCGGVDNIFPHHENEIAQSECFTEKTFVKHWAHAEHLIVEGKKMSKSLGNFFTLRDLVEKGYKPNEIRLMLLQTHYRTQLNFTLSGLEAARSSLLRIEDFLYRMKQIDKDSKEGELLQCAKKADEKFQKALSDDLNISVAFSALFDLIREGNSLADEDAISKKEALFVLDLISSWDQVLSILPDEEERVPDEIQNALGLRERARKEKNWSEADRLRDFILQAGYIIDDTPGGSRVKKK